jgi:xylulokinase
MAVQPGWPVALGADGVAVYPHPGPTGFGILVTNPNGMSVVDWARALVGLPIEALDAGLAAAGPGPSPVVARPVFTPLPDRSAAGATGGWLGGLTLTTTPVDIVRALLEGIACTFAEAVCLLGARGLPARAVRATGGGSRSSWWLQLKSDLTGVPIEVVDQDEPGAFGAAILAGVGAGVYPSVSSAVDELVRVARRFEPNPQRAARYDELRARQAVMEAGA